MRVELLEARLLLHADAGDDGHETLVALLAAGTAAAAHVGNSPFLPPEENDHTFVIDQDPNLDTGCTYQSGGPLVFSIPVDRVVGDVVKLKANGLISEKAHLKLPAFDVDFDGTPVGERDRITFNGHDVTGEFLTGENNTWKLNEFDVDIEWVNFPTDASSPAMNTIRIDIDTLSTEDTWCTSIDWASLKIDKIVPPTLFVHGILSDSSGWTRPWRSGLDSLGVPNDAIDLGSDQGLLVLDSIQQNAQDIAARVQELTERWGVDKINIVGHSKGGIDSRHFIENSDQVNTLVQIGTPNAGSPLADRIQQGAVALTGLLGAVAVNLLVGPAGAQLTTPHMAAYNFIYRGNSSTKYFSQAGDYRFGGLGIIDAVLFGFMGDNSDTIVPVSSVNALPYATHLSPIQTVGPAHDARHFSLSQGGTSMVTSSIFYDRLVPIVTEPIVLASPAAATSTAPSVPLGQVAGAVGQAETQSFFVPIDGTGPFRFLLTHFGGALELRLTSPSGFVIDPAVAGADADVDFEAAPAALGMGIAAYEMRGARAETGVWRIDVTGASVTNPAGKEPFIVMASAQETAIQMTASLAEEFVHNGEPIIVSATLTNSGQPLTGAVVTVDIVRPDGGFSTIVLLDDGISNDGAAGDGVYAGRFTDTTLGGFYQMEVRANGATPVAFARNEFLAATVTASNSQLTGQYTDNGVDTNGNGLFEELVVNAQFEAELAGDYRFLARLDAADGSLIDETSGTVTLTAGTHTLPFVFDGEKIFARRVSGPYSVSLVRLAEEDELNILPLEEQVNVHQTAAYSFLQFEHPAIFATGSGQDLGSDLDGDGLFDRLEVRVELLLDEEAFYNWSARLEDSHGTEIGFASGNGVLPAGTALAILHFDGELIGANGVNGPFFVKDLLIFSSNSSANISDVYTTGAYLASQFEGFVASNLPPEIAQIGDRQIDVGSALIVTVTATDPDVGQTVTYALESGAPSGAAIDPLTGVFAWTPPAGLTGQFSVTVTATDNGSPALFDSETFVISVNDIAVDGPHQTLKGRLVALHSLITGPQLPGPLQYLWTVEQGRRAVASGSDADFSFTPGNDGVYFITLQVTDAQGRPHFAEHTLSAAQVDTIGLFMPIANAYMLRDVHAGGAPDHWFLYGPINSGWTPLTGDWNGDGVDTPGLYDRATGRFLLKNSNDFGAADSVFQYGPAGGKLLPIVGDWDGDGMDTVGLFDPLASVLYLKNSNAPGVADVVYAYGAPSAGWLPIVGDWDGDGTDSIALYARLAGVLFVRNAHAGGAADVTYQYGPQFVDWIPLAGDWDGDGLDTPALYSPFSSRFYLRNELTAGPADVHFMYGVFAQNWLPLAGDWDGLTSPALPLAGEPVEPGPSTPSVTEQQLRAVFDAALARLAAAGASESALGLLRTVQLQVIDLAGNYLGMAAAAAAGHAVVYIDVNAAGHGWFVDITPTQDEEFSALGEAIATSATAHADLLSVVLEELVRILDEAGLEHDNGLIVEPLAAGIRRLPRWVLDQVFAQWR